MSLESALPHDRPTGSRPDLPSPALALRLASPPRSAPATPGDMGGRRDIGTRPDRLRVRATAYHRDEADHFSFGSMSALGTPLRAYGDVRSAAADWSRFPAGTEFQIAGDRVVYVVDDYGSALVGTDTVDLCQPDEFAMEDWGARQVDIEILKWGSRARSLEILKSRAGHAHVDTMIAAIESEAPPGGGGR